MLTSIVKSSHRLEDTRNLRLGSIEKKITAHYSGFREK